MMRIQLLILCATIALSAGEKPDVKAATAEELRELGKKRLAELKEQAAQMAKPEEKKASTASGFSGVTVKILCSGETEPTEYPLEFVNYFVTLKNMIEDLGIEQSTSIPFENATKPTLDCLRYLLVENNAALLDLTLPLDEIQQKLAKKFTNYGKMVNLQELLLALNYLDPANDPDKKLLQSIAALYADSLQKNPTQIMANPLSNIPLELQPFVAGWLLHNLLNSDAIHHIIQKREYRILNAPGGIFEVALSNTGTENQFACIYTEILNNGGRGKPEFLCLDPLKKEIVAQTIEDSSIAFDEAGQCVLSYDGKYLAIVGGDETTGAGLLAEAQETVILIFDLSDNKLIRKLNFDARAKDLITVLFNDQTNAFDLLIFKKTQTEPPTELTYYSVNIPSNRGEPYKKTDITIPQSIDVARNLMNMNWSCINGQLIGLQNSWQPKEAVVFNNDTLYTCFRDLESNKWSYELETHKHFIDLPLIAAKADEVRTYIFAVQRSFIPHFEQLVSKKIDLDFDLENHFGLRPKKNDKPQFSYDYRFDSNHLHFNFIQLPWTSLNFKAYKVPNPVMGIYYPCDPRLLATINWLNKEVVNNNRKDVLIDAYFLYHYHLNQKNWQIHCASLWNSVSKEIKQIYGLEDYVLEQQGSIMTQPTTADTATTSTSSTTVPAAAPILPAATVIMPPAPAMATTDTTVPTTAVAPTTAIPAAPAPAQPAPTEPWPIRARDTLRKFW